MKQKIIFIFLGLFLFFNVHAQAKETGEIQGKVRDEGGEGLSGVEITAKSPNLQGLRTVFSSKNGDFRFPLLPVGIYTLTLKLEGFAPLVQENVIVRLGRVTDLNVTMKLPEIREEIVVVAEAPLIDKTSTDTSFHLSSEDLEKIPAQNRTVIDAVKITPGVTGVRVNTRRGNATQGQPNFRGEGEEGNNWIVDGLSISGVRLRNSGMHLNFDSIDEIQVISDPFSPEFGSAYGGIINMVTKSGSNDIRGEFSLVFMNKDLQASREEQLSVVSEPDSFSNYNLYFNLGGPVVRDKLWFFVSNNFFTETEQTKDGIVDYLSVPGGRKTVPTNNLFAKLTYAFNSNHSLSLTSIFHKSLGQKGGTGIPDLFEEKHFSDLIFRLNYKGIINTSTFIEAGLGYVKRDSFIEPVDKDLGPAQYYVQDLARNINNSYGNVRDDQKRLDFNIKLTKYLETDTFGRHELILGYEYYSFSSHFGVEFTGRDEDLFPDNGFDTGTKYYFSSYRSGSVTPKSFYEYGEFNFRNSSQGIGLYFKDKVTWGRLTLMAGFRSQTQVCLDHNKEELWSWNLRDFLSPRFSLAIDLKGDGMNILKLGWGRFSDLITTMPMGLLSSGAGLKFRTYIWQGSSNPSESELHDPSYWLFDHEQGAQPFEIAKGLKPNFLTRFLIEFDRKLGRNWALKARYVRTKAEELLEVLMVPDLNLDPPYKFLYDNFEPKRRNYEGFEIELSGKIGTNFFLNASYCHSSAKGTNPGQTETGSWDQEEGSTPYIGLYGNHIYIPDIPGLEDEKAYWDEQLAGLGGRGISDAENESWYGKLPYSVDHNLKINMLFIAPYGLAFSSAFEYISGYYWERLGYVPLFGGHYSFPEGRGTTKTPSHFYLDLGLEKEFRLQSLGLPQSMILALRLDIFNVLNSQEPISYVKENIPIFGEVWARQQPRQARMMLKIKW
ncbi:MAG: TonB-dependent receptor plug domain-containing protein [Candidatus Aminicenantes bacterium]|nr:TonB-dependent receptor plug domain-containing protein [Candidatus Aminicenantes bacterium]